MVKIFGMTTIVQESIVVSLYTLWWLPYGQLEGPSACYPPVL